MYPEGSLGNGKVFDGILEIHSDACLYCHEATVHIFPQLHDHVGIVKLFKMGEFILWQLASAVNYSFNFVLKAGY